MTLTVTELQLLLEALQMAASRHRTCATAGTVRSPTAVRKHDDKQRAMEQLRDRLVSFRARRDVLEVAS